MEVQFAVAKVTKWATSESGDTLETVSYTHLDVYKRQDEHYKRGEEPHMTQIEEGVSAD